MELPEPEERDRLFDQAVGLEKEEQRRLLDEACRGRPQLRRRLEELLAADRQADGFLRRPFLRLTLPREERADPPRADREGARLPGSRPAGSQLPGSQEGLRAPESGPVGPERKASEPPGAQKEALPQGFVGEGRSPEEGSSCGPYRILRPLGRGGMGQVYLAERREEGFQRLVALKVIRAGFDSPAMRARFLRERQALARLEHPGIARLYDGDMPEDRPPYLVMEWVKGKPIDVYCRDQPLSVVQRIDLFLQVCDAVSYAHRNLVVHRDLKPSNVLVTDEGRALLLDFGIAKLLQEDDGTATRAGHSPLSLRFASPEQVRGDDVATGSDVYSLGVLLYLLVTGRSPYRRRADLPADLERAILERPPVKPSEALTTGADATVEPALGERFSRSLFRDLDVILLQCLRKRPDERYESVAALAEDLRRCLQDLPIRARPEPWALQAVKFWRRHRLATTAALMIAVLTLVFLMTLAVQNQRLRRQRDLAEEERAKAATTLNLMTELLQEPDAAGELPHRSTAQEVLDRETSREPGVEIPALSAAKLAAIHRAYASLGQWEKAAEAARKALRLRRELWGDEHLATAESLHDLGQATSRLGRREAAEPLLRRALEIRRRELPADSDALTATQNELGLLLYQEARLAEAKPLLEEALRGRLLQYGPDHLQVAEVRQRLAVLLLAEGSSPAAEAELEEVLAIRRKALGEDHPRTQGALNELALARTDRGEFEGAAGNLRELLASQERTAGPQHLRTITVRSNLAAALAGAGSLQEAEALTREALTAVRRHHSERWDFRQSLLARWGRIELARGRPEAAEERLREALRAAREGLEAEDWRVATRLRDLGEALRQQGRAAGAEELLREARALKISLYGKADPSVLLVDRLLAQLTLQQGDLKEAESSWRRIRTAYRESGVSASRAALDDAALAHVLLLRDEIGEAELLVQKAVRQLAAVLHEEDPRRVWVELVHHAVAARQGRALSVLPEMRRHLRRLETVQGPLAFETQQGRALVAGAATPRMRAGETPGSSEIPS